MAAAALAIVFNVDQTLQTDLGSYTSALQRHTEESGYASHRLNSLRGTKGTLGAHAASAPKAKLQNYGRCAGLRPDRALAEHDRRPPAHDRGVCAARSCSSTSGRTRASTACARCRTCRRWYAAYHKDGLDIVGVHTPEFAFEHVLGNVEGAVRRLGVTWPVALDNAYGTWNAYGNQYWPADYLVDKHGDVRAVHFGEGDYSGTEQDIRTLLGVRAVAAARPNATPTEATTPETYLGPERLDATRYAGSPVAPGKSKLYMAANLVPQDAISYGGEWDLAGQIATAGIGAQLLLHFQAKDVYIVLGGTGRVTARLGGKPLPTIDVDADRLYTVLSSRTARNGLLRLGFTPGVRAYSFTFG